MEIISKAEAKAAGLKHYFTGKPCKKGHLVARYVNGGVCMKCLAFYSKRHKVENPEKAKTSISNWRINNHAKVQASRKKYEKKYAKERLPYKIALRRNRDAHKIKASPAWVDLVPIKEFYVEAARRTSETGIPHEVDHWSPLRGKFVCGLHVADNLQIIPADENLRKGNRFDPMNPPPYRQHD